MLHVTEEQVREILTMKECVRLMRETFASLRAGTAINEPRHRLFLPTGSVLHSMAGAYGKYFGTKIYGANAKYGASFFFHLFDAETAKHLALFDANYLGQIRTGAASGLATDLLASPNASILGVIGSGFQAETQIAAIRAVREIKEVRVWSRNAAKCAEFAKKTGALAVASAEEAVRGAEIVATATFSAEPVLKNEWITTGPNGVHINAMGSNRGNRRELPSDLVLKANLIAIDSIEQGKSEAGDLLLAPLKWDDPRLIELSKIDKRPPGTPLTIFKSLGLAVEDVAAAAYVYEQLKK